MSKIPRPYPQRRFVGPNMKNNVLRRGGAKSDWGDIYHFLVTLSWFHFLILLTLIYLVSNIVFAVLYLAGGSCILNAQPGSFLDAFFFSVQTMATIGYGGMSPSTVYANSIVTIEALVGLLGVAMVTGLAFARFSLPTARVLFSRVAVISPNNGIPTLMFRVANERHNLIVETQLRVTLMRNEITEEGQFMRRFHDLELIRKQTPLLALSWTVMHPIDIKSPLYGITDEMLAEQEVEIVVTLTGIDETVSQTIHAHHSFIAAEVLWNMRFIDIFSRLPDGRRAIDYTRFHDVIPI